MAGPGAGRAADRVVATVMQRVVGQIPGEDVSPDVGLGPVGQRVELPDPSPLVALELGSPGAGGGLLAAQAADPGASVGQRVLERGYLGLPAAALRGPGLLRTASIEGLDRDPELSLKAGPHLDR